MSGHQTIPLAVCFLVIGSALPSRADDAIRSIAVNDISETAEAVVVSGKAPLAYTGLIFPIDIHGRIIAPGQSDNQSKVVLARLRILLREVGSSLEDLVRVHVYVARADVVPMFRDIFARKMTGKARPAITFVVGPLRNPKALVAVDAVAVAKRPSRSPQVATLKPGPRVFVSGQAEPAETLAEATRKTLESLEATLKFLDLGKSDIVQLKAFFQPISDAEEVERAVADFFDDGQAPPLVLVAWEAASPPIEIELVASGGDRRGDARLEFLTPPGMTASPVYCRVAVVRDGPLIFVGGLTGSEGASGQDQTRAIFARLKDLLSQAGSDFRHLVKATYYVSDDEASQALNDLRPEYYDPARPPAASKAMVKGVGAKGRGLNLDMIATPVPAGP